MVDNADVVRTLGRVAGLLEITGENSIKVRAYRITASRANEPGRDAGISTMEQ